MIPPPRFGPRRSLSRAGLSDDWFELAAIRGLPALVVQLTDKVGSIAGRVTDGINAPVPGAPVYLIAVDDDIRRAMNGVRLVRAGADGRYRFSSLIAGEYVVASSFEFEDIDLASIERYGKRIALAAGGGTNQDLDLHHARN